MERLIESPKAPPPSGIRIKSSRCKEVEGKIGRRGKHTREVELVGRMKLKTTRCGEERSGKGRNRVGGVRKRSLNKFQTLPLDCCAWFFHDFHARDAATWSSTLSLKTKLQCRVPLTNSNNLSPRILVFLFKCHFLLSHPNFFFFVLF